MDMTGAIASASIGMHQGQLMQSVGVSMAKKTMDTQATLATELIQDLQAANPVSSFGHQLDVSV